MIETAPGQAPDLVAHTRKIAASYASHNHVSAQELPSLIVSIYTSLTKMGARAPASERASEPKQKLTPDQIRKSIRPDALISFVDGKPYKVLKRHLSGHGLTPESYRQRYGLPVDYPVVAPSYSTRRSEISRSYSFGKSSQG